METKNLEEKVMEITSLNDTTNFEQIDEELLDEVAGGCRHSVAEVIAFCGSYKDCCKDCTIYW